MYETGGGGEGVSSRVEAALRACPSLPGGGRVRAHRPRGSWVIGALHGRGAEAGVRAAAIRFSPHADAAADTDAAAVAPAAAAPVAADADAAGGEFGPEMSPADTRALLLEEGAGWLDAVVEVERGLAQLAAGRARALAGFARCRPGSWDRRPG